MLDCFVLVAKDTFSPKRVVGTRRIDRIEYTSFSMTSLPALHNWQRAMWWRWCVSSVLSGAGGQRGY